MLMERLVYMAKLKALPAMLLCGLVLRICTGLRWIAVWSATALIQQYGNSCDALRCRCCHFEVQQNSHNCVEARGVNIELL